MAGTLTFVVGLTGLVLGVSRGGLSGWKDDTIVIAGLLAAGAILLPIWVMIERRSSGANARSRRFSTTVSSPPPAVPPSSTGWHVSL